MRAKILNLGLILASLFGYLEWGDNQSMFLFQGEMEIISKLFTDPLSVVHPFTLLPLFGQVLLVITLFQKKPNRLLTILGLSGIGILLLLIFVIGIIDFHLKLLASTLPFLVVATLVILEQRKNRKA